MLESIDSLLRGPASKVDLNEAAKKYATVKTDEGSEYVSVEIMAAYKAGAKQMMKDAVVGHISTMYNGMVRASTRLMDKNIQEKLDIKFGDTVKLIIIKED